MQPMDQSLLLSRLTTATEQIVDLRQTLKYLGVPIKSKAYMFGDNTSVVTAQRFPTPFYVKGTTYCLTTELGKLLLPKFLYFTGVTLPKTKVIFSVSIRNSPKYFISSETFLTSRGNISHPVGALRINISTRGVTQFTSKPRFSGY